MKICLINNLYKPFNRGGTEMVVDLVVNEFKKRGNEVFVISTKPGKSKKDVRGAFKIYYLRGFYYNLHKIPIFLRFFWHIWDLFDFISAKKIKKIINREKPRIIITHNLKGMSYLMPRIIKSLGIKHIHVLHDIQLLYPSGLIMAGQEEKIKGEQNFCSPAGVYQKICRKIFGSPDIVISPSRWLLNEHVKRNFFKNSKKNILRNPVFFKLNEEVKKDKKKEENFNFLYVGQIEKHKGVEFLIEVFEELKLDNYNLTLIGDGSRMDGIKINLKNKKIKILGRKDKEEVTKIMRNSDCLIVPSLCYENSPSVIYEAACVSLPVVASRIGGIVELVHELGGVLFEPSDKQDFIHKLRWITKHKKELIIMGKKAQKRIKNYSVGKYVKRLEKML